MLETFNVPTTCMAILAVRGHSDHALDRQRAHQARGDHVFRTSPMCEKLRFHTCPSFEFDWCGRTEYLVKVPHSARVNQFSGAAARAT